MRGWDDGLRVVRRCCCCGCCCCCCCCDSWWQVFIGDASFGCLLLSLFWFWLLGFCFFDTAAAATVVYYETYAFAVVGMESLIWGVGRFCWEGGVLFDEAPGSTMCCSWQRDSLIRRRLGGAGPQRPPRPPDAQLDGQRHPQPRCLLHVAHHQRLPASTPSSVTLGTAGERCLRVPAGWRRARDPPQTAARRESAAQAASYPSVPPPQPAVSLPFTERRREIITRCAYQALGLQATVEMNHGRFHQIRRAALAHRVLGLALGVRPHTAVGVVDGWQIPPATWWYITLVSGILLA